MSLAICIFSLKQQTLLMLTGNLNEYVVLFRIVSKVVAYSPILFLNPKVDINIWVDDKLKFFGRGV